MSQQEHLLSKGDETPTNLEQAETLLKRHEALLTTMDANDDKVNGVLQSAELLVQEEHFAADKISKKVTQDRTSIEDPNPDPRVFGPPGSGSISQRYGSGSFYH
jgi:hypothetical protein